MMERRPFLRALVAMVLTGLLLGNPVVEAVSNMLANQKYAEDSFDGYLNLNTNSLTGVEVKDTELVGKIWSLNYGWIELQPQNGGVTNSVSGSGSGARGTLGGKAWGENIGWVEFGPIEGEGGVYIDSDGFFHGTAWSQTTGFLAFGEAMQGTTSFTESGDQNTTWARTSWRPNQADSDDDGLSDDYEVNVSKTDPFDPDSDSSETPENEADNGITDGEEDYDEDGLTTLEEIPLNGNPHDNDTDDDGLYDLFEAIKSKTALNHTNSDSTCSQSGGIDESLDSTLDANEDHDGDGLLNSQEQARFTDPCDADSDDDTLGDLQEVNGTTDPNLYDTDFDGMSDACEVTYNLNPLDPSDASLDPDGDDISNSQECSEGSNPFVSNQSLPESGMGASGKAGIRNLMIGMTREEINLALKQQQSDKRTFAQNYAKYLAIYDRLNEGTPFRKVTYIDADGNERLAGFIKGKLGVDKFRKEPIHLVYRREKEEGTPYLASALDPEFQPRYEVMNFSDLGADHEDYRFAAAMWTFGLLRGEGTQNLLGPRSPLTWEEFLQSMLWAQQKELLTYDQIKALKPLKDIPIQDTIQSRIFYTSLRLGLIDQDFEVKSPLTRAEILEQMAVQFDLNLSRAKKEAAFKDVSPQDPLYGVVQAAQEDHWFDFSRLGTFSGEKPLTKLLFSTWFVQALGEDNPLRNTPAFDTTTQALDAIYDDIYKGVSDDEKKPQGRPRGFDRDSNRKTDIERLLQGRDKIQESREETVKKFGPSRKDLQSRAVDNNSGREALKKKEVDYDDIKVDENRLQRR